MALLITGASIFDGIRDSPLEGHSISIDRGRVQAIGPQDAVDVPPGATIIDARGKFVLPGLMDANVHLLIDTRLENLVRYEARYEELIAEAAQVALKAGVTTVFDSWGPRQALISVRDKINDGKLPGSRIFCAGNIVGLDGPLSADFWAKSPGVASEALVRRINARWAGNVGPALTWMTPEQVAVEVRAYIRSGIDFMKYAASEHRLDPTTFLQFSPRAQVLMIEEAHRAGITAQAHCMSVEALRIAIESGCNLIQHGNITGPTAIPESTIELFAKHKAACAILPWTNQRTDWVMKTGSPAIRRLIATMSENILSLIPSGVALLLSTDGGLMAAEAAGDAVIREGALWSDDAAENLGQLGQGHFLWLKAMEEKGMPAMAMLKAATRNIAVAYGKERDLGTIEKGKIADILILHKNPLEAAEHYRTIHMVIKDGKLVDRAGLPTEPILTKPAPESSSEESAYTRYSTGSLHPMCC